MELIFEIILQFLGEILLQFAFESLSELGLHGLAETFEKRRNPFLSTIGFALWGGLAGGLSLLIMPRSFISDLGIREANVLVTPLLVGGGDGADRSIAGQKRAEPGGHRPVWLCLRVCVFDGGCPF